MSAAAFVAGLSIGGVCVYTLHANVVERRRVQGRRIKNLFETGKDEEDRQARNTGTYDRVLVKVGPVWNQGVMKVHGIVEKLFF